MTDNGVDAARCRAMKDALAQVCAGFLALSILGAFFNAALGDIFSVEVAVSAYFVRQTKHPAELCDGFAWKRAFLRYQDASYIIDGAGLQHLIDEIGVTDLIGFGLFDEVLIGVDAVGVKTLAALTQGKVLSACLLVVVFHQDMLEHVPGDGVNVV